MSHLKILKYVAIKGKNSRIVETNEANVFDRS